ncbi:LysR family transcriptional regulator [Acinetobacter sp. MD2(2019)]|uniref:HTH-type transcriptional regulator AceR n=1 Tax=Acinetobacter sp. MD2(2019) TaxID=2605273 RepID=UPI002D1F326D|nr:LysR family transcriptional regulator [Acinetobacter sp. MD2(2019)]MEB3752886.1 LysR family transcriptional regulator [Acinetobacter sp. MD2(2019)]
MNINQEQLTIFKTVMETGSFSAAARQLGKVPSTVSMSIANLEIDLNLQLFERVGREPVPTAAAQQLYERTVHLITEIKQWKQHAYALSSGLEAALNIVVVSELIHTDWVDYITVLEQQFPTLSIHIFSAPQEDAQRMLMRGEVQFALMFERECLDQRELFIELKRETLVAVASQEHALAQFESISLEQLQQQRQIIVTSRDKKVKPDLLFSQDYWRTDHHHVALSLIQQGLGWGILPLELFKQQPQLSQHIKILNIENFTAQMEYFLDLVWSKETELGLASRFLIDYVRKQREHLK